MGKFRVGDRVHFQDDPEDTGTVIDVDGTEIWGVPNNVKWDRGTLSHWADDSLVLISRHVKTAEEIIDDIFEEFDAGGLSRTYTHFNGDEVRSMLALAVELARK